MSARIHLYHSNDLHSQFEQWPKITDYFKKVRKRDKRHGIPNFFFDIGDHMDRAHAISEASMGKHNVLLMNKAGYDDVTIGNNEGITLSKKELDHLYDERSFNVLVANLFEANGERPNWIKPYSFHRTNQGLTIGVIGVTVAYPIFYHLLGWSVKDPFDILPRIVSEVRERADAVILLSHLGINDDERVAEEIEGIDVILGGHTHHLLQHGKMVNGTLLGGAGKHGKYIGEIALTFDEKTKKLVGKKAFVTPLENSSNCEETEQLLTNLMKKSEEKLQETVINLKKPFELSWFKSTRFTAILAEGLKEWCQTEISMVNAGVLLDGLDEGPVTKKDLHKICPHPINPCKVVLTGSSLKEVILHSFTEKMQNLELKGLGFRGKLLGRMVFDGIEVKVKKLSDGLNHVEEIKVLGEAIDPKREYEIATLDMYTFGYLYPELAHAKEKHYYMPEMLRDVLEWKLRKMGKE